jgi:hypothetical protein
MTITTFAIANASRSETNKKEKNTKIYRRGRSLTVRNPEDSTNAACNIHGGKRKTTIPSQDCQPKTRSKMENDNESSSLVATMAFADRFALFGNSTLALITSFVLLVVAVAISLLLEDVIDAEGRT